MGLLTDVLLVQSSHEAWLGAGENGEPCPQGAGPTGRDHPGHPEAVLRAVFYAHLRVCGLPPLLVARAAMAARSHPPQSPPQQGLPEGKPSASHDMQLNGKAVVVEICSGTRAKLSFSDSSLCTSPQNLPQTVIDTRLPRAHVMRRWV